ncbi:MAG TPA: thiolase family protein, partial [Clostridia bacterium]|nr:thiolase family protein [Clostridia bacterium]
MFEKHAIVSYARTPVGGFLGSLKDQSAVDLGVHAARAALERGGVPPEAVDEVILGCVGQYGLNCFLARLVALGAGLSHRTTALTVNRMCASGLQAIVDGAALIERGDADAVLAGGAESMSNFPYTLQGMRAGLRMGAPRHALLDALTVALCEPTSGVDTHIAHTADNIARAMGLTRQELDRYACESQARARRAIDAGYFREEIVPVEIRDKKETRMFDADEHPRATSVEKLARLQAIAGEGGFVTAGNASGINDGAAALALMRLEKARAMRLVPIARLVDYAVSGVDPMLMGLGPVDSTKKLFEKNGLSADDMGVIELNEAFAAQALGCIRALGLDPEKVNPNGSGIALGHPLGATGAIIS